MALLNPLSMTKLIRIRMKLEKGTITLAEAEVQARPFMNRLNDKAAKNAKKKGEIYTPISYENFLVVQLEREKLSSQKRNKA